MARRASSKLHPGIILGAVAAIAVAVIAGKSLIGKKTQSFGDVDKLSMDEFLENGNMLRNSECIVEGQIDEKLQITERSQLVSVKVTEPGGEKFVAIEIPAGISKKNIDTKQKYAFRVKFRQGGIPVATGLNRL